MGALLTAYQARYSAQIRRNVSNPQLASNAAIDTVREGLAETDVTAQFTMRGITFNGALDTHIAVGTPGIYARLLWINGHDGGKSLWDAFIEDLNLLRESTSRDRIVPETDSLLDPTADTVGTLPAFDRREFKNYIPNGPDGTPTNTQGGTPQTP